MVICKSSPIPCNPFHTMKQNCIHINIRYCKNAGWFHTSDMIQYNYMKWKRPSYILANSTLELP